MKKIAHGRSKKTGLPPGTLVHIGNKKIDTTLITKYSYNEDKYEEKEVVSLDETLLKDNSAITWTSICGIHEAEVIENIGTKFGLHHLVMEDILNTEQRPKIENYGDYLYIVSKMLYLAKSSNELEVDQVSLILTKNAVFTFQESSMDIFGPVRERLNNEVGRIRKLGADYLLYSLLDALVDNYFNVLEKMGDRIEEAEVALLKNPENKTLESIHLLKSDMLFIHKSIWPLREVLASLERGESSLIKDTSVVYFRDVYDHVIQAMDTTETYRDILSGMLDIYLSSVSNKMNEVIKVLTVFSTIFMPLTFIVGVYGMNFDKMPELSWDWGYPAVWVVMLVIAALMFVLFKRKRWL